MASPRRTPIVIAGVGAVGGYVGGLLAGAGREVALVTVKGGDTCGFCPLYCACRSCPSRS